MDLRLVSYVPASTNNVQLPATPAPAPVPAPVAMPTDEWVIDLPVPEVPVAPVPPTPPVAPAPAPVPQPAPQPPVDVTPQPAPQPPAPPPPPVYKPTKVKAQSIRGRFLKGDDNKSEKLSRKEFRQIEGESFQANDRNKDKKVTWREFLMTQLKQASFKQLDRDGNGVIQGKEITRIETTSGARYDADENGRVSRKEFLAGRERDERAVVRAKNLSKAEKKKQNEARAHRRNVLFQIADKNDDGVLRGSEVKGYGAYDKNKNKLISKKTFAEGQRADRETAEKQRRLEGKLSKGVAKRLRQDRLGQNKKLPKKQLKIDAKAIASLLGSPSANVQKAIPGIMAALKEAGIKDRNTIIAVLATIRTEVGSFLPIHEYGGPSYYAQYNGRDDLGNRDGTNDGVVYHGRGYIQLTGRANYITYGNAIGENLVGNPNKALRPKVAAEVLTAYFKARGIPEKARAGDWDGVRYAVNGGTNGLETFRWAVSRLKASKGWLKKGY